MGNDLKKLKRKKYVIHSSFLRKYSAKPLVDVNNSYEVEKKYQMLYIKLGDKDNEKGLMKILFLPEDSDEYLAEKAIIDTEWECFLRLNEHPNIVHYLGKEYCTDKSNQRRCEILAQQCDKTIESTKPQNKFQLLLWITQIAQALQHAHKNSITHGNVAPSSIAILNNVAVLKDFEFCEYSSMKDIYDKTAITPTSSNNIFSPPEDVHHTKEELNRIYYRKKKDVYMWAACAVYFVGDKKFASRIHAAKKSDSIKAYDAELIKASSYIISQLKGCEESGVNAQNVATILAACLSYDVFNRPSFDCILSLLEILDRDVNSYLKSICHVCGLNKKRLHQLECNHMICGKCFLKKEEQPEKIEDKKEEEKEVVFSSDKHDIDPVEENTPPEEKNRVNKERMCEICGHAMEIGIELIILYRIRIAKVWMQDLQKSTRTYHHCEYREQNHRFGQNK